MRVLSEGRPTLERIGNPSGCVNLPKSSAGESRSRKDRETRMPDSIKRPVILTAAMLLAFLAAGSHPARAQTLKAVQERGTLNCGVSQGLLGFSSMDEKNAWSVNSDHDSEFPSAS